MANTQVEVKKAAPVPANVPDGWRSLRTEMDQLFDRFAAGWGMPSLRRFFDVEPAVRYESSFSVPSPATDISEDETAYKVTAELPGMSENDIDVSLANGTLTLKGEKQQEAHRRTSRLSSHGESGFSIQYYFSRKHSAKSHVKPPNHLTP